MLGLLVVCEFDIDSTVRAIVLPDRFRGDGSQIFAIGVRDRAFIDLMQIFRLIPYFRMYLSD